mmetsp:Transcript_54488/g.49045  ORF Transcript_54488/g.49045 Transcript_54488/m.49045 type:complete len:811 (-) Transcript_54488:91-2523(-)|eukprot:CAMPEP_0201575758 /NCGR_PEP_ID=MMETSP0190_2-20130828/21166_1 /ASSEMBLY_ACC=CAM_ASM_000263 /TAXON_ID=37353 /ORGANISM="Rosalina sp." /LENGTH=810 /DNA_ID=CAMNT_0048005787 /DNA_START=107 /DNA_END=2539 /DNA_ORIENTATION=+
MSDDLKTEDSKKEDKEARKKRKELRRKKREEFQNRLKSIDGGNPDERNPIILEIVKEHLKKDIDVFQARWQSGAPLSNQVFLNTPLFWYKKHKWSHKDVKEFFKIVGVYKENLDSELSIIWGIDETSKKKKKEKRKKLKEKHLRKESFASLLTLRHSSLRLMQERSMQFVQKNDPKAERASIKIWNYLVKTKGGTEAACEELNHPQFNIALVDNDIQVDPDMSVDLFYELIRTWEIIEKHREDKKNNPEKYANSKKNKYKQSRLGANAFSMKQIGGSSALSSYMQQAQAVANGANEDDLPDAEDDEHKKKEEEKDPPQKEKIKYIKKKFINRQYIKRMLRHINKNIKREHQIANPKKLKKSKLLLVVFGKIFDAIQNQTPFDVQNDYISQALTPDQLNNPTALLEILETRDAEWKQRVQCLEYIESNIMANDNLHKLFEEENFLLLIVGWSTQLYDERSRITQTAAELFPSLLTQLLANMETPAMIFEEENGSLSTILEALFTLLKNKRAKTLSDIAHDVLIETINILSTVAQDLDHTAYHRMMNFLLTHTLYEHEKHEKVRAGCIAYSLFIIYGTQSQENMNNNAQNNTLTVDNLPSAGKPLNLNKTNSIASQDSDSNNPSPVASDNEADETESKSTEKTDKKSDETEKDKMKKNVKLAKVAQRPFLFEDEVFMQMFAKIIGNGIEDRGKESRDKAMKVLKKIESSNEEILEKYIDGLHLNKYTKWKKFNQPKGKGKKKGKKKNKRVSPIKRQRTVQPKKLLTKKSAGSKSVGALVEDKDEEPKTENNGTENNGTENNGDALTIPNGNE